MKSSELIKARQEWKKRNIESELFRIKKHFYNNEVENLYKYIYARHSWIYKTIIDKGLKKLLNNADKILLVGSGMYPYSLIDMFKRYPDKSYFGIEILSSCATLSKQIIEKTPAKDSISIIEADGVLFDYSNFTENDMIFISCDVDTKDVIERIVKTSGAQFWVCAPYEKVWIKNLLTN